MNPPDLLLFEHYGGNWHDYESELNKIFMHEIVRAELKFQNLNVNCRRLPESAGRWSSYWHLIQTGNIEEHRRPDMRRCERLRWIPWVITQAQIHDEIEVWKNKRKNEENILLWYKEEYLVVLSERRGYWLLKTAYCTTQTNRINQLRREREKYFLETSC